MAVKRVNATAKSKGRAMKKDHPGEGRSANSNPTRSRAAGANRKDRKGVRRTG